MADLLSLFAVFLMMFLFGMTLLRIGLYQLSYRNMRQMLQRFASNPFKGMVIGMVVTAIMQSSSCTIVLTVGLVAVGMISFRQSVGIILGANIGTTVTAEIMTIYEHIPMWPVLIIGAALLFFRKPVLFGLGAIIFGLGTIFIALNGFETLASHIQDFPIMKQLFIQTNEVEEIGIVIGTVLTGIIQSSTAATGLAMAFLDEDVINLAAAIAIMLGANIGTCITAWIASIGSNREAKLVAMAHIWLNILGVLVFAPFIQEMATVAKWLSGNPVQQLAHISVIFNVVSSMVILPFVSYFSNFVLWIHRAK